MQSVRATNYACACSWNLFLCCFCSCYKPLPVSTPHNTAHVASSGSSGGCRGRQHHLAALSPDFLPLSCGSVSQYLPDSFPLNPAPLYRASVYEDPLEVLLGLVHAIIIGPGVEGGVDSQLLLANFRCVCVYLCLYLSVCVCVCVSERESVCAYTYACCFTCRYCCIL